MIVRPLSNRPEGVRDALLSHGWGGDLARLTAGGVRMAAFHVSGIDGDAIEALLVLAPRMGLELITGDDWVILAGGHSRLGAFARPWLQPEALRGLAHAIGVALPAEAPAQWQHTRGVIRLHEPVIVGILNLSPDSFSDGGNVIAADDALDHVDRLLAGGAAVVDMGGESTRPGATPTTAVDERARVMDSLAAIVRRHPQLPVSIDTMHASTASAALDAGAAIVNDVTAGRHDPEILAVAARAGAGVVLSHSRGVAGTLASYEHADFDGDVTGGVIGELQAAIALATGAGIAPECIAIDPGFGFGKTGAQSLQLLAQLDAIAALNHPLMVGLSRKRFLGDATGRDIGDRDRATAAACALAFERGARLFRVHAPAAVRDALSVASALLDRSAD